MSTATAIEVGEVGGVPAYFAYAPGPTSAGLIFRVGQADETLARRGLTHLVEHLALHRLGLTDYHSNGATGPALTHFYLQGRESDVAGFLQTVCTSLTDLPLERLERERDILATEQANRGRPALPSLRYGAQGYGLASYPEWGVESVGPEEVAAWSRDWFTRDNAALWVTGARIPPDLEIALPPGARRPAPAATSALEATPAWIADGEREMVFTAVVRRSAAASAYAWVLGRELFRVLRHDGGYSYTATAEYDPRDGRSADVMAYADAHPDKEDAVVGGFLEVLAGMKAGRVSEDAVAAARARQLERFAQPDAAAAMLTAYASDSLLGRAPESLEDLREQAGAVTVADVRAAAAEAHASALLSVPEGQSADVAGFTEVRTFSRHEVPGQVYPAVEDEELELVVGRDGVSLRTGGGPVTVRFGQVAAALHWPDGRRVLIGLDGTTLTVEPTLFALDDDGRSGLDARLDPAHVIKRPARDPAMIPRPVRPGRPPRAVPAAIAKAATRVATREATREADDEPDEPVLPGMPTKRGLMLKRLLRWCLVSLTAFFGFWAMLETGAAIFGSDDHMSWMGIRGLWVFFLLFGYGAHKLAAKRQPF